jgi:hypothetical protein
MPEQWASLEKSVLADRSLDEAYCSSLDRQTLEERNKNQVVSKVWKTLGSEIDKYDVVRTMWIERGRRPRNIGI